MNEAHAGHKMHTGARRYAGSAEERNAGASALRNLAPVYALAVWLKERGDRQVGMAEASSQLHQLHVSLSRTVAIRFADQQPLLAELREALQRTHRSASVASCPCATAQQRPA